MNLSENCLFLKKRKKMKMNSALGTFDTITKFIEVKGLQLDNMEDSVESWLNYYTFYHEQMHYYQFISSSLGIFITCLEDLKNELVAPFVNELDFVPPFIDCVEKQAEEFNQKIYLIRDKFGLSKYQNKPLDYIKILLDSLSEIELLMWVMEGGFSQKEMELITKNTHFIKNSRRKIYRYISQYYEHTGKNLSDFYNTILKKIQESKIVIPSDEIFFVNLNSGVSFGYNHILESQARYCELTRLIFNARRFGDSDIHKSIKSILTKQDYYQEAYNIFKSIVVDIENCDEYFISFIFCLICDYSINIPIPQIPQIKESFLPLFDFTIMMPARRFINICHAVNKIIKRDIDIELRNVEIFEPKFLSEWNKIIDMIYKGVNEETGYSSPITVAKAFIENNYEFDYKVRQHFPFDYDNIVFLEACKTRLEYPLFFINPELFRLLDREKYIELSKKHGPPIMRLKKGIRTLYEHENDEAMLSYLTKNILFQYISNLFFESDNNSGLDQFFDVNKKEIKEVIYNRYGTVKTF